MTDKRYIIRHAADEAWLLDMTTDGFNYKSPIKLQGAAGWMWELLSSGKSAEETAEEISSECGAAYEEVLKDTKDFLATLKGYGVDFDIKCLKNDC